ncbi:transposase IS200 like protein [mine drainage metagenome]|uniref:Transposase IS200 like protein n=1 Tax=mine drainage metagenome TaxID=410659 RepID=A0A1J5PJK9_9ZZZZ
MARKLRLEFPGACYHVINRGNYRADIFKTEGAKTAFEACLFEACAKSGWLLHAYVLMSNHFHLLATPQLQDGLPKMMQAVGHSYVRYFNHAQQRSGTLWEGRYKSTLIQSERYLLACMVYIDLNAVRAAMVMQPQDYPWSSHAHYLGLHVDRLITPHALFWELGNTPFAREAAYASLVQSGIHPLQQAALTDATLRGWALGEADFVADLQKRTQRRVAKVGAGRPFSVNKKIIK